MSIQIGSISGICCPFIGVKVVGEDGVKTDVKYLFRILALVELSQ